MDRLHLRLYRKTNDIAETPGDPQLQFSQQKFLLPPPLLLGSSPATGLHLVPAGKNCARESWRAGKAKSGNGGEEQEKKVKNVHRKVKTQ